MIRSLCFLVFVAGTQIGALPSRIRREDKIQRYCNKHLEHYRKFCSEEPVGLSRSAMKKLAKFCPAYEQHCGTSKTDDSSENEKYDNLIIPPPLPKGGDFAALDLPLGSQSKASPPAANSKKRLTAAIIASCTPECTAPHCTDECKCANTHPKVHVMCNPPANAQLADICQKWYEKCPMFQPIQYY
ncbi:hypothetical protein DICVIV_12811 [Dictyocaulus viviparus]|uniref:Uncharacterized protein n=1 Tax=Dictyocaulus viviparus TaxID=29172 RepID=A0A0D8X9F2_DICVI|nr:hypothetical protein DICVIV_12811 [Dictyocaulus viviparus]